MSSVELSIVSTLYCSAPFVEEFYRRVTRAAATLTPAYEIVLVNDGSPDDSLEIALRLHAQDARLRVIDLSRNFGHHKAMMTGLEHARGKLVFLIDSDLEEDPDLLGEFWDEMQITGADVVYATQSARQDRLLERAGARAFYAAFNALSTVNLPQNLMTLRLMTRRYVSALVQHRERELMIAGLWAITGFHQVPKPVQKRHKGITTYDVRRKIATLVNSVTSFSNRPLVYIFYLGVSISTLAGFAALYLLIRRVFFDTLLTGWPSLIVSVWLLGGLTLLCLGVIGIYVSKIFLETKQRPYTIVRAVYESDPPNAVWHGEVGRSGRSAPQGS